MRPHFGYTRHGLPVHLRAMDHLRAPDGAPWVIRFNSWLALRVTGIVGTMWCAYAFAAFDLISLPAAIHTGTAAVVSWVAQTFLQLVLLAVIMVGQDVQARASDARAAKSFEDTELIADRLNTGTRGGITEVLDAVHGLTTMIQGRP